MPLCEALPSCRGLRARHAQKECTGSWEVPRLASCHTGHWSASGRRGAEADDVRKREVGPRSSSCEAGEQRGAIRRGVGGAKDGDQGECGPTKHAPGSVPGKCVTGVGPHTTSSGRTSDLPSDTRGKSRMRQGARTDLCGGRGVISVPTATRREIDLTTSGGARYPTMRRDRSFHQGTGTGLLMSPEARTTGRWARRWKRTLISSSVIATSAGMSMRSRKIWRAWASS